MGELHCLQCALHSIHNSIMTLTLCNCCDGYDCELSISVQHMFCHVIQQANFHCVLFCLHVLALLLDAFNFHVLLRPGKPYSVLEKLLKSHKMLSQKVCMNPVNPTSRLCQSSKQTVSVSVNPTTVQADC